MFYVCFGAFSETLAKCAYLIEKKRLQSCSEAVKQYPFGIYTKYIYALTCLSFRIRRNGRSASDADEGQ